MKYKAMTSRADINWEQMMTQATSALDAAAECAENTNDVEGLLNTAAMWIKLAESIDGVVEFHKTDTTGRSELSSGITTGFQRPRIVEEETIDD